MPNSDPSSRPKVTVVVPVRNEADSIADALRSLAAQDIGPELLEVIIMDGDSSDNTRAVCAQVATEYSWARFVVERNGGLTAPCALNAGLRLSSAPWYARLDARTRMSPNYLSSCIEYLEQAGDPLMAAAGTFITEPHGTRASAAIATALSHRFGVGQSYRTIIAEDRGRRTPSFCGLADCRGTTFGGFDEELTRNQDDEFSSRARSQGARIVMLGAASIRYWPRERFRGLAAQYFQYGLWKAAVGRTRGYFPPRSDHSSGDPAHDDRCYPSSVAADRSH